VLGGHYLLGTHRRAGACWKQFIQGVATTIPHCVPHTLLGCLTPCCTRPHLLPTAAQYLFCSLATLTSCASWRHAGWCKQKIGTRYTTRYTSYLLIYSTTILRRDRTKEADDRAVTQQTIHNTHHTTHDTGHTQSCKTTHGKHDRGKTAHRHSRKRADTLSSSLRGMSKDLKIIQRELQTKSVKRLTDNTSRAADKEAFHASRLHT